MLSISNTIYNSITSSDWPIWLFRPYCERPALYGNYVLVTRVLWQEVVESIFDENDHVANLIEQSYYSYSQLTV